MATTGDDTSVDTARRLAPRRLAAGAGWGALATAAMSAVMLAATATGLAPMPEPIPAALVSRTLGDLPQPGTVALAAITHLAYGALAGAVLAGLLRRGTAGRGALYGAVLWALMGLVWLPYAGWGLFGMALTPRIAVATLVLHLVYGITLGLLLDRPTKTKGGPR
ncbi:hypothetical protein EKD16_22165 [Streptomonospora litoralis]|uniref:Uncharacterized protein n=2 Tax=Streptomonospora litoralis TaxID=2498135 RepID=A0A4P6Q605_9ACTN|nr:hypothetical protein EKD16_22165 [Streptomonospora litoralis]